MNTFAIGVLVYLIRGTEETHTYILSLRFVQFPANVQPTSGGGTRPN